MSKTSKKLVSEKTKAARKDLVERSQLAKIEIEANVLTGGPVLTVNEMLVKHYMEETRAINFHTFKEWKEKGFNVKKGSTAFRVWSKPRKAKNEQEANNVKTGEKETIENAYKFWGMCCLFNENQVEAAGEREAA